MVVCCVDAGCVLKSRASNTVAASDLGAASSAVASRTSRASVSGGKPSGSERVAIEKAT